MKIYLAGPMRGYKNWNWPHFDRVADDLRRQGHTVWSPAEYDRELGLTDDETKPLPDGFLRKAFSADVRAISESDTIVMLQGWEKSEGATLELGIARMLGLKVLYYGPEAKPKPKPDETILAEAARLVYSDRNKDYGHPADDFRRTALAWEAVLGVPVTAEQVALCMIGVKIAREAHKPKRDNRTDMAGYAACLQRIHDRRDGKEAS